MSPAEQAVLLELYRRTLALREPDFFTDRDQIRVRLHEENRYGPRWSTGEWFSPKNEAERQRLVRAMHGIIAAGLAVGTTAYSGRRVVNLQLTDKGRRLAAKLAKPRRARGR